MLGFGAGVMLAACCVLADHPGAGSRPRRRAPGLGCRRHRRARHPAGRGRSCCCIDYAVPHEHFIKGVEGPQAKAMKRAWLFVLAICLHNLPEGLAIGVAFAGSDADRAPRRSPPASRSRTCPKAWSSRSRCAASATAGCWSASLGVASGLIEPHRRGARRCRGDRHLRSLLPWGLAAAAGAMLFVVSHEIIPESHRKGHEAYATGGPDGRLRHDDAAGHGPGLGPAGATLSRA